MSLIQWLFQIGVPFNSPWSHFKLLLSLLSSSLFTDVHILWNALIIIRISYYIYLKNPRFAHMAGVERATGRNYFCHGQQRKIRDHRLATSSETAKSALCPYQWFTQEFCSGEGGGGSTNSVEDRGQKERGSGGGSPLVRDSGGSCNLVQEISFHTVKFS
jgi:hypothetical protein